MKIRTDTRLGSLATGAFALAFLGVAAVPALAYTGQQFAKNAKVSMAQAEAIVAKEIPGGRITDRELENEKGGSGLRYSFDVMAHGKTLEVGVDAMTGQVLEDSLEGPHPD
jgi:uncharacterized membrane protein YkoI